MFNLDEIYTVSDFLSLCNKTVENNIPTCWLQGEISNLSRPASGHWYFSLKDSRGQVRCALFRLNQRHIKFTPENGLEVLVRAAPTLYETRGDFQLIIQHVEPVGVGNLNLAFEQLKNKLSDEGLFDSAHKKSLPDIVKIIGVISSSTGAVIQDIIRVLNKRYPFAHILLFDSIVQGKGAFEKIGRAIIAADNSRRCDVLIVARGGGSLEDLWAFNEESLARIIYNTKTPIVSAIGHETDTTIADFVADASAPTPSAAAMLVTPDKLELYSRVTKLSLLLRQQTIQNQQRKQTSLDQLKLRINTPDRQINHLSQQLDYLSHRLNNIVTSHVETQAFKLSALFSNLKQHSPREQIRHSIAINQLSANRLDKQIFQTINNYKQTLVQLNIRLRNASSQLIEQQKHHLASHAHALGHLSPLSTLSRGYSITTTENENQVLTSITNTQPGQIIKTRLGDGVIHSKVEKNEKK
jgi:exodeoxyribonuclease VII large subunit